MPGGLTPRASTCDEAAMTVLILYVFDQFQALYFREVMYLEWLVDSHRMCWFHIDVVRGGHWGQKSIVDLFL
jgi:hypothetical protein